jgi:hypothetical protein
MTDVLQDYYLNKLDTSLGGKGMTQTEAEAYENSIVKVNKPWFDIKNEGDRKKMLEALEYGRQFNKKWYLNYGPKIAKILNLNEIGGAILATGVAVEASYKISDTIQGVHKKEYEIEEILKGIVSIQKQKEDMEDLIKWFDKP